MLKIKKILKKFKGVRLTRKKVVLAVLFILITVLAINITSKRGVIEVETTEAKKSDITIDITASGEVTSSEIANLTFATSGKVSWLNVSESDRVTKWQTLGSLDVASLSLTLKKLLNSFEREFTDFDDTNYSVRDDILTDTVRRIKKRAQLDLNQTVLDVEIQKEAIALSKLTSPFNGIVVSATTVFPGMFVSPGTVVATIANPDKIYFEAKVGEADISKVSIGGSAKVTLDAYRDETFEGKIEKIAFNKSATSTGGTSYKVQVSLPKNENLKFKLGMGGDVQIILSTRQNVLTVPTTALVEESGGTFVWLVRENIATKVSVKVGTSNIDEVEILEGVSPSDIVITRPSSRLTEGAKVKFTP